MKFNHKDRIYIGNHVFELLRYENLKSPSKISPTDFVDDAGIFHEAINTPHRKKWEAGSNNAPTPEANEDPPTVLDYGKGTKKT